MRDYLLHNIWWKLFSLLLAGLTWYTIEIAFRTDESLRETPVISARYRSFSEVPVTLLLGTTNTMHFRITPAKVTVDVSGEAASLEKLKAKEIHAFIDLSEVGDEKKFRKPVQAQARDLKIRQIMPAEVIVERLGTAP